MAPPPDHGSGSGATPDEEAAAAAAALRGRQTSGACACGGEEPEAESPVARHEREISAGTSFSSPDSSPALSFESSSTNYLPASNKLSCESIPFAGPDLAHLSSFSSTSSYESFFHIEASDLGATGSEYLDIEPAATRAPGVQTMVAQGPHKPEGGRASAAAAAYDPKRLPSSMFRTRSTSPAEWSATSNDSLFSIQLSDDMNAHYADLYYDAAGFPRFPSLKLPARSDSSVVRSGGLCVRHDCARCSGGGSKTRKSVRFAAAESVSSDGKHSVVVSTLKVAVEEEKTPAPETKAPVVGWCELGCCLSSPTASCWPRCCGCGCQCKWWL